jgi:hypothetical protein
MHNWRFFFKPSVVRSLGNPNSKHEEVSNRAEFLAVMQAYGQSFLQPDIGVFQQNLGALEQLNTKWKLYHKVSRNGGEPIERSRNGSIGVGLFLAQKNRRKFPFEGPCNAALSH